MARLTRKKAVLTVKGKKPLARQSQPTPKSKGNPRGAGRTPGFNHGLTLKRIIEACYNQYGLVTYIAEELQVERATIYKWQKTYPEVKAAMADANEHRLDRTENAMFKVIDTQGYDAAKLMQFHIKCKGKQRGYVEKLELAGQFGHDITIGIGLPKGEKADDYN